MFKNFFKKEPQNKTGIYHFQNEKLVELDEVPGNGSINSVIQEIGFDPSQLHTVITYESDKIDVIGFKVFTSQLVFAISKDKKKLNQADIVNETNKIDWEFEYSSSTISDILDEGISNKAFTLDFLSSVLKLEKDSEEIFHATEIDLYLEFENNILKSFASSNWLNDASKWLKGLNKDMFDSMLDEAKTFQNSEIEAMEEVNEQCASILNIPSAIENEFIPLHTKANGNINFFNLLVAHYNKQVKIEDFKQINKGRFTELDDRTLEVGNFKYFFEDGSNISSIE